MFRSSDCNIEPFSRLIFVSLLLARSNLVKIADKYFRIFRLSNETVFSTSKG